MPGQVPNQPPATKNVLGIVAFVVAIIGFIFACIPGALIIGWILLPIAFILSLVALFIRGKKGLAIAGLVISIVGTIVGVMVFVGVVASSFDDAFSDDEVIVNNGQPASSVGGAASESSSDGVGTRANPHPIGTSITDGDWTVTLNGVNPNADDVIQAENRYNEPAGEGMQYLMVNITATYDGSDPEGKTPRVSIDYVTVDGNTIGSYDKVAVIPEPFDHSENLYSGASTSGNLEFAVPSASASDGVLVVQASPFGSKQYFSVK